MAIKTQEEKDAEKRAKVLDELAKLNVTNTSGTELVTPISGSETPEQLEEKLKIAKKEQKDALKKAKKSGTQDTTSAASPTSDPKAGSVDATAPAVPSRFEDVKSHAQEQREDVQTQTDRDHIHAEAREVDAAARRNTPSDGPAPELPNTVVVKYKNHIGEPQEREFSEALHGPNFRYLAEEFKKANASRIIS